MRLCFSTLLLFVWACGSAPPEEPVDIHGDVTPAWGPSNGDAERGLVIAGKLCVSCHLVAGEGKVMKGAPAFAATANREDVSAAEIRMWLQNPQAIRPETLMPNLGLGDRQVEDLIAYLYTLRD